MIKPTDDFFQYVNAEWNAANPIPPDESRWGSFNVLRVQVEEQLKQILDEIAARDNADGSAEPTAGIPDGDVEQKIRDFYRSAMDIEKRNRLGAAPLGDIFKKINSVADATDLARIIGVLHRAGADPFWLTFVEQNEKQSEVMALHFWQGGLGLPDRDYYLTDDEKSRKIRADYLEYVGDMLHRVGLESDVTEDGLAPAPERIAAPRTAADKILEIETRLAKASLTRVELRDVEKMYNKMIPAEFAALAPQISLPQYFEGINPVQPATAASPAKFAPAYFIVGQPQFFEAVSRIIAETPTGDLKIYLRWHVLNGFAKYLSEELEQRSFDFYARTFSGAKEMKPLWRRALKATDDALDELLGKLYVARHFSEDAKRKIKDLVEHLVQAYRARIERLDWMSPATKQKAIEKLGTVSRKLGYPDVWKDYRLLVVDPASSFAENVMRAHAFEFDRKLRQVGGSVDRGEWLMSPQTVNAYYMPPMNDIVFPAAILQPPFFDPAADDAMNFGGIGTVIGHELTHGFDDQGSRFDARGNLNEWWTPEDKARFDAKAAHLAEQFDTYEPLPGMHVNGKLTLGENIADLGGMIIAYDGLKLKLAEAPMAEEADLTPEQQFFINYAVTERGRSREELLRLYLQVDPHSPSEFRVNGPLSNMTEFYEAFGAKPGDKLWREEGDRVKIW